MAEENKAKEVLAQLEKLDVQGSSTCRAVSSSRCSGSSALRCSSMPRPRNGDEFPLLRRGAFDDKDLTKAGGKLENAERMAPTHAHPSAKTTAMNYVAGPFAAMVDRARDLFSKGS